LRAVGARAVLLEVDPANQVAISLYSRFGFTHTGTAFYVKGLSASWKVSGWWAARLTV
jgi:ribosomal protein S18 acetylase RimI-like enzyme